MPIAKMPAPVHGEMNIVEMNITAHSVMAINQPVYETTIRRAR